jgi:hypothetical protein
MILREIPSYPVAFLMFNLFICLLTKCSFIGLKESLSVTILPTISKFYERAIFDQLMEFLNNHFNPLLSAFRSGFGCQTALRIIIEDWKKALNEVKNVIYKNIE